MPTQTNTFQVTLGTSSMEITPEPVANYSTELLPKSLITGVTPVAINSKSQINTTGQGTSSNDAQNWVYKYDVMTVIWIDLANGERVKMELQDITNQATWSTGDLAGQQAAIDDINTWLAS